MISEGSKNVESQFTLYEKPWYKMRYNLVMAESKKMLNLF